MKQFFRQKNENKYMFKDGYNIWLKRIRYITRSILKNTNISWNFKLCFLQNWFNMFIYFRLSSNELAPQLLPLPSEYRNIISKRIFFLLFEYFHFLPLNYRNILHIWFQFRQSLLFFSVLLSFLCRLNTQTKLTFLVKNIICQFKDFQEFRFQNYQCFFHIWEKFMNFI